MENIQSQLIAVPGIDRAFEFKTSHSFTEKNIIERTTIQHVRVQSFDDYLFSLN
jgi:hypothetical protein